MKEIFKRIRFDVLISAILCIAFGIVLMIWPLEVTSIICRILSVILIIMGAVYLVSYFINGDNNKFKVAGGLIILLIGVWILLKPESVIKLIPIIIGVVLLIHAIEDFKLAFQTKAGNYSGWWSILLLALISGILGVLCICDSFGMVQIGMMIIGICLIYDGVSDIWIVTRVSQTAKNVAADLNAVDTDATEENID